jgi:hypothetical protein
LCLPEAVEVLFTFQEYSVSELKCCGIEFCRYFQNSPGDPTTREVLTWFAQTAPAGVRVFGRFIPGEHEYMLDQCHTTFPSIEADEDREERWERALQSPLEMRLALESEWARDCSVGEHFARVLDDAWKVALVRANAKVVIFASTNRLGQSRIVDVLHRLRACSSDDAPWLWIDVPRVQRQLIQRRVCADVLAPAWNADEAGITAPP